MFKYISVIVLSFILSVNNASAENIEFDNQADELKYHFILAIKNRDCDNIFAYLNEHKPHFFRMPSNLSAYFLEAGICIEANPELAAKEYLRIATQRIEPVFAMARLGNLYYRGLGVTEDQEMAMYYFKQASRWQAPIIWNEQDGLFAEYFSQSNDVAQKVWGLSRNQLENRFSTEIIGPLPIPQPLIEEVNWLKSVYTVDGYKILEIAHHFHDGTGGYREDISIATQWILYMLTRYTDPNNLKLYNKWHEEEEIWREEFLYPLEEEFFYPPG